MGKLLPISRGDQITYQFYEGHFLVALARAYKNLLEKPDAPERVALVIDELNRGNSAAIFGTAFQLLDRDNSGWSSYQVDISQMEFDRLIQLIGVSTVYQRRNSGVEEHSYKYNGREYNDLDQLFEPAKIRGRAIRLPPNLSILCTINTSDTSIYYMDSAFKRRWEWQFVDVDGSMAEGESVQFSSRDEWYAFADKLNRFIRTNSGFVRHLDDKQVGYWFFSTDSVSLGQLQNKLMFYLWDSVFARDRKPLSDLLGLKVDQLATFGDLANRAEQFVRAISTKQ